MVVIFNWGRDAKKIANAGLMACEHCKNMVVFEIYESYGYVGAFFLKVGKGKRKYTIACPVCKHGYELDPDKIDQVLRDTINIPSYEEVMPIWDALEKEGRADKDSVIESMRMENDDARFTQTLADWRDSLTKRVVGQGYPADRVKYVVGIWTEQILNALIEGAKKYLGKS